MGEAALGSAGAEGGVWVRVCAGSEAGAGLGVLDWASPQAQAARSNSHSRQHFSGFFANRDALQRGDFVSSQNTLSRG
jgi:hypothetical protein